MKGRIGAPNGSLAVLRYNLAATVPLVRRVTDTLVIKS